jgi:hypothetical protein
VLPDSYLLTSHPTPTHPHVRTLGNRVGQVCYRAYLSIHCTAVFRSLAAVAFAFWPIVLSQSTGVCQTTTRVIAEKSRDVQQQKTGPKTKHMSASSAPAVSEKDHNRGVEERKRLRVEWEKPRVVLGDALGNYLDVQGKLLLTSTDGKKTTNVDWYQPIRVLLGKTEKDRPDWSAYHDSDDSVWADDVVGLSGEFRVRFQLDQLSRPIGASKPFQIGLCLGTKVFTLFVWKNTVPILPQTVGAIEIPGSPALDETLRLINGVPSPIGWDYDPVALIRAVNHLHALGKDKSIKALREFVRLANVYGDSKRDAANIDTSDQQCLHLLIPLLFETIGKGRPHGTEFYISVEGDIPFHNVRFGGSSGPRESTGYLVDWAEQNCRIRSKPLKPTNDPLSAVDALYAQHCQERRIASPFTLARMANDRASRRPSACNAAGSFRRNLYVRQGLERAQEKGRTPKDPLG